MLINTYLDTEDFVHLYYPEDETPQAAQGCGAGARMHSKYPPRPPSPQFDKITSSSSSDMCERERTRAPPPPEPPPHRVRAADLYPRVRTHYDEPGLDVPFTPICAEFVQFVGRTSDNGAVAMSNYRVHVQPRRRHGAGLSVPLRMVDAVEVRDMVHLVILCKDGKTLKCSFNTGDQCLEWWRRLTTAIAPVGSLPETFAAAYAAWAKEQPPASIHRALVKGSTGHRPHWFGPELERLGFTNKGAWRVSASNADYKLCPSYPPLLIVPSDFDDNDLEAVARFRAMRRIPAVVWRHRGNGAIIARSSQPEVGWLGWRSSEDEKLLGAFVNACQADRGLQPPNTTKQPKLLIVDARSYASAVTNRARGGGCECQQYYPLADIQFMCLSNIHHVRRSFQQLRQLVADPPDHANWLGSLERTLWLQYVSSVGRAASGVAASVAAGRPVLVHCSDGWDRTPQLVAGAQLLLDPYYRSVQGFRVLIEREWLDFGHKFADRCGHQFGPEEPNERSPIFLQWLDFVHQVMRQYPTSFEFSEAYLVKLLTHVHSCMFGTFLCNSPRERSELRVNDTTADVWKLLEGPAYRNHLYCQPNGEQVLWPELHVRHLVPWWAAVGSAAADLDDPPPAPAPPAAHGVNGGMSKTRSCDNLMSEGERRSTPQRRCSDPNIAPDIMKAAGLAGGSSPEGRAPRVSPALLTDSILDSLPKNTDQVDGLNPAHLSRSLASNSSSLERELRNSTGDGQAETSVGSLDTDYLDIIEAARSAARPRHVSITWRSLSESSQPSDDDARAAINNNLNSQENDIRNHNVSSQDSVTMNNHTASCSTVIEGSPERPPRATLNHQGSFPATHSEETLENGLTNGDVDRLSEQSAPDLGNGSESSSNLSNTSSSSSRSERARQASKQNERVRRRHVTRDHGEPWRHYASTCVCGAGSLRAAAAPDGLPPQPCATQLRLHQLCHQQREIVEELSRQLEEARAALAARSPRAPAPAPPPPPAPASPTDTDTDELEVGEEARSVLWVPDAVAPRCQYCHQHFWLARRRHHCRKCGGIFCGSCSELSSVGAWASVRLCRRCRHAADR